MLYNMDLGLIKPFNNFKNVYISKCHLNCNHVMKLINLKLINGEEIKSNIMETWTRDQNDNID